jgi:DNA-directed RNA polymerase specialized sigma24 family protein
LVFSNELIEILADEVAGEGFGDHLKHALDGCLRRLDPRQREVVNARYVAGNSIADLAKTRNESPHRLYRDLEKSRTLLAICVRSKLAGEGPALAI